MTESDAAVAAVKLVKTYGKFRALDECNLAIRSGIVFGLLGPNGAGKTTLIRTLLGFIRPTSGSATVFGRDVCLESVNVRRQTAYLPAEAKLFRGMRGGKALRFYAQMHPNGSIERALDLAERLDLDLRRRIAFMSTGMRQKLSIACVLSCRCPLLVLDEPTANLDPTVRSEILSLVAEANRLGQTVIFSSHVMSEIEEICDEAAILRAGKVVHTLNVPALKESHRVRAVFPQSPIERIQSEFSGEARVVDATDSRYTIDWIGPLESFLPFLQSTGATQLSIEPIGLRSIYEKYHRYQETN